MIQIRTTTVGGWYIVYDTDLGIGYGCNLRNLQTTITNLPTIHWPVTTGRLNLQPIIVATAPTFDDLRLSHPELFI